MGIVFRLRYFFAPVVVLAFPVFHNGTEVDIFAAAAPVMHHLETRAPLKDGAGIDGACAKISFFAIEKILLVHAVQPVPQFVANDHEGADNAGDVDKFVLRVFIMVPLLNPGGGGLQRAIGKN